MGVGSSAPDEEPEPAECFGSAAAGGESPTVGAAAVLVAAEAPRLVIPDWAEREGEPRSELVSPAEIMELNKKVGAPASWELLFSSKRHGKSYNRMIKEVCHRGASLVIIREAGPQGRVFGGYADASWVESARFFGGSRCFLFHIPPGVRVDGATNADASMVIHRAVGRDSNFMYVNSGSEGNPNCLAFGGELYNFSGDGKNFTGVFGLSIETSMTHGTCAEVTTFSNPIFPETVKALDRSFAIDEVEIWATDPDFELSVDERYELQKKMGRGVDAGLDYVLEAGGVAQNAKAAGIDDHKPGRGS
jgi:opacity protein-like surface antigen